SILAIPPTGGTPYPDSRSFPSAAERQESLSPFFPIPLDGSIIFAQDMARPRDYPSQVMIRKADESLNLVCFPCRSVTLYGLTDPREYIDLSHVQVLDAGTDSPPFQYGYSSTDLYAGNVEENCSTLWADPALRVRLTFGFGFQKKRFVLIHNSLDDPVGVGYPLADLDTIPSMILEGTRDMWRLDAWRMAKLEAHGVGNPRVSNLHREAKDYLEAAQQSLDRRDYGEYRAASEKAWGLESKAYSETLSMTNNMIRGVLFYLALLLPFAYCMERLLLGARAIARRIGGMGLIFGVSFAVLAIVHPAFRFTLTPFLVLEAFVILALAGAVGILVVGRFDRMLKERKVEETGLHEEAGNVGGITIRAVDLGIANIRRRKQRGLLTAMTIVMVMFTLLSFVSIMPDLNISKLRYPEGLPVYPGQLTRDRKWLALRDPVYDSIRRNYATGGKPRAIVAGRAWFFSDLAGNLSQIDLAAAGPDAASQGGAREASPGRFTAVALLCMDPTEPRVTDVGRTLVAGRWFRDEDELGVILPVHVATQLGYGPGDLGRPVVLFGWRLPLIGLVDEERFNEVQDLDGEPLTPVNFVLQNQLMAATGAVDEEVDTLETYVHYAADQVAIVPLKFGRRLGATLRSVAARALPGTDPLDEAEAFARRSNQTILASDGDSVALFASIASSRFSAAGQIVVPLFLGFVMAMGTMLGSVYERKREIFIYNSVGLSPSNVASLFMAESAVYALVGACLGFLLGQAVSKALLSAGALSGLALNYSAGTTVFVTSLTMLIVLASTLYPARQAFRAAIPEARGGRERVGEEHFQVDRLSFFLPFVATPEHIYAIQAYMGEFLAGVQGVAVGPLAVDNLAASCDTAHGRPAPTLRFRAWLAPFDLGISHDTELRIVYRPERDIYQCHLTAVRFSGDQQSWRRLTPRFVLALRKQLLMWRIVAPEAQSRYDEAGRRLFGAQPNSFTTKNTKSTKKTQFSDD
ncbi:MAG: ABC transporter permease, partial [Candidatus Sumerlaeota bacterium]|nr:ABC transporter permease [Candidatus Sumerlaeota bacterium]